MEGLVSSLIFAAFFCLMMRFGCGAHMMHGHGGGGHGERPDHAGHRGRAQAGSGRDPVCGMDVAAGQGYTKTYERRDDRLCSRACLDKFEANPDQYASVQGGAR